MKNKEHYTNMMNDIHVPQEMLGKVMNMSMEKNILKKKQTLKYATSAAAAFALCFIVSNGICYAATGNTWVGKAIVYINGEKSEQEITWHGDEDNCYAEIEVPNENGESSVVIVESPEELGEVSLPVESDENELVSMQVDENAGRQYFRIGDSRYDITEDLKDGHASGVITIEGQDLHYEITYENGEYKISANCE